MRGWRGYAAARVCVVAASMGVLAATGDGRANGPEAQAETSYAQLSGHGGPIRAIHATADGRLILTSSFDNTVGVWSAETLDHLRWLDGHDAAVNAAIAAPDGGVITAGDDFSLRRWTREGQRTSVWEGHQGKILGLARSPGHIASASWDGSVGLWPLNAAQPPQPVFLNGHRAGVNAVAFAAGGQALYSASTDGTLRLWDVASASLQRVVIEHGFGINTLTLDEDAGWLAYGAVDGVVRVMDLASDRELASLTGDRRPILALDRSPSGRWLAFGDGEGYISLVDTKTWEIVRDFRAAVRGPIWALAFLGEGRLIAAGLDPVAAVWPLDAADAPLFTTEVRSFQVKPGTVSNGERQFARKCSVCHTLGPDSGRRAGPTLYRIFGRSAGTLPGYVYSDALLGADLVWSDDTLDKLFDIGPAHYTPGSKMPMQRIIDPADRRDLIDYLRTATAGDKPFVRLK